MTTAGVDIIIRAKNELAQGLEEATRTMRTGAGLLAKTAGAQLQSEFMPSMMGIQGAVVSAIADGARAAIDQATKEFADWPKDKTLIDAFRGVGIAGGEAFTEGLKSIPIVGTVGDWLSQGFDAVTGGTMAQEAAQAASRKAAEQMAAQSAQQDVLNKKIFDYIDIVRGVVKEEDEYQQMQEQGQALIAAKYDLLRKAAADDMARQRFLAQAQAEDLQLLQDEIELRRQKDAEAADAAEQQADDMKWLAEQAKAYDAEEKQRLESAIALNEAALEEDKRRAAEQKQIQDDLAAAETRLGGAVEGRAVAAAAFRNDAAQRVQAQVNPGTQVAQAIQSQNTYFERILQNLQRQADAFEQFGNRFPDMEIVS